MQAEWWYNIAAKNCKPVADQMFVTKNAYTWVPWDKLAMSKFHLKKYEQASAASLKALSYKDLPEIQKKRIMKNIQYFKNLSPQKKIKTNKKIEQARVSEGIQFFEERFHNTLGLKKYDDPNKPALFYGCYPSRDDVKTLLAHNSLAVMVWCGSDAMWFTEAKWRPEEYIPLLQAKHIKHVATSEFIMNDLRKMELDYKYLPIVVSDVTPFKPAPKGDKVYVYANSRNPWLYGIETIEEVEKALPGITFIKRYPPLSEKEKKEDMFKVYKECFVGLRPTVHDGICHTAVEMGLMGRRMIWNGCLPNAIHWNSVESIVKTIEIEKESIGQVDEKLANEVKEHIQLPKDWLNVDFWI
jgi:hypothetical protein